MTFNIDMIQGVYSGLGPGSSFFTGYIPAESKEAMRRVGDKRIYRALNNSGWQSPIIGSCLSQRLGFNGALEFGHNWGGSFINNKGYSALRSYGHDGVNTGLYSFDDGAVRRANIVLNGRDVDWIASRDTPLSWDSYIFPLKEIEPYTP